jgi:quinol monooxygenase YgiN
MITILAAVDVIPGREEHFEALWRQARPQPNRYPGFRSDRLLRDTDRRGRYVVSHEWEDRTQFDAFVRASGTLWLLHATESWMTALSWSYLEDVAEAAELPHKQGDLSTQEPHVDSSPQ